MKAGLILDAKVAEKILGWRVIQWDSRHLLVPPGFQVHEHEAYDPQFEPSLPRYSTDIAAAWEVVEKMTRFDENSDTPFQSVAIFNAQKGQVGCRIYSCPPGYEIWEGQRFVVEEVSDTAPHAICLAALKAKGVLG